MDQTTTAAAVPSIIVDQHESANESRRPSSDATSQQALGDSLTSPASTTQQRTKPKHSAHYVKGPGFVIPLEVSCKLSISFEGSEDKSPGQDLSISLHNSESYDMIESEALACVERAFADDFVSREVYFRYGNCTIVGDGHYRFRHP